MCPRSGLGCRRPAFCALVPAFGTVILFVVPSFRLFGNHPSANVFLRRGPRGASHEKFHAAPSKKQALLEGPLPPRIAKPFSPYSIQKRPKPQICPKFVAAIVFGGSSQGGQKFAKVCQNLSENYHFQILTKFCTKFWPPDCNSQKPPRTPKFWTNLGFGAFWML